LAKVVLIQFFKGLFQNGGKTRDTPQFSVGSLYKWVAPLVFSKHMLEQRVHLNIFALFGSRARGGAGRYSDMDVLVVIEQLDSTTTDYISDCAWENRFSYFPISFKDAIPKIKETLISP
jgi:hypothetical protein